MIFQYPGINSYIVQTELGNTFILPISSILSSICVFRLVYLFKVIKNMTKWSSLTAENVCEKYVCQANSSFAFKALQKEYPFITLTIIFVLTCICFGFSLRVFELHYWETKQEILQDWTYEWNAVWCIFVSMTTVGYGDFFPKTHLGRIIVIIACIVGTYFVSMMMVFMTQKSILNDTEFKSYKLVARLKLRKEIKSIQANLVYESLLISKIKKNISKYPNESKYKYLYEYKTMNINKLVNQLKEKDKKIKTFEFLPTKEQLYDLSEKIDTDLKEINNEIENLCLISEEMEKYTDNQIKAIKYLKKSVYETELMYKIILENKYNYGKLGLRLSRNYNNLLNIESLNCINKNIDIKETKECVKQSNSLNESSKESSLKSKSIEEDSDSDSFSNNDMNYLKNNYIKLKKEINYNIDLINGDIVKELFKDVFSNNILDEVNKENKYYSYKSRSNIRNKTQLYSSPLRKKTRSKYKSMSKNISMDKLT